MSSPLIYIKFQAFLILQIIAALQADNFSRRMKSIKEPFKVS